jgi:hypothetical protein
MVQFPHVAAAGYVCLSYSWSAGRISEDTVKTNHQFMLQQHANATYLRDNHKVELFCGHTFYNIYTSKFPPMTRDALF